MSSLQDKLTSFGQFLALLSGQLDVRVTTKDHPLPNALVLPELQELTETDLDVLYGLCLREAGTLAKSKNRTELLRKLSTKRQLQAATLIDQGRTERFLTRRFGGAGDILSTHFGKLAHNPLYQKIIFGLDPKEATPDQVFLYAFKWHMLGCPKFGWEKIFPQQDWERACSIIEKHGTHLLSTPLRSYADAVSLSKDCLAFWYQETKTQDESATRGTSKEEKAYEEAIKKVEESVRAQAAEFQSRVDAEKEKAQKARSALESKKEEMKDTLDPLQEQLSSLNEKRQAFSDVKNELRQSSQLASMRDKIVHKEEKTKSKTESLSQKKEDLANRAEQTADVSSLEEKLKALQEERGEKQKKFDQDHAALEHQRAMLEKELEEATSPKKQESLQNKLQKLEERSKALEERQQNHEKRMDEKEQALSSRMEQKQARAQEKAENLNSRANEASQKLEELNKQLEEFAQEKEKLEQKALQAEQDLRQALKEANMQGAPSNIDELVEQMQQTQSDYQKAHQEWEKATRPLEALKNKMMEANKKASELAKKGRWETEKALRKIEENLSQQGIELELTEKMEEMEGWDAANKAQENFDQKASDELQMSVINGVGGGRGTRDMMLLVEDTLSALHEVDPNAIFEDVQKLSPLSGFAQGPQSGPNDAKEVSSHQQSVLTTRAHTVWSKKFDRVIPAPVKKASFVQKLRSDHAKDITRVKKLFVSKMKPSFKPKFVGNKEEGDLDSRNLWKFAANQGDDFFEVMKRRPVNKSTATIMVDLSGSMEGSTENASQKLQKLVLLLSEGFSACNIPHEVLGYYAPVDEHLSNQDIPQAFNRKSCRLETVVIKNIKDRDLSGLASLVVQQADNSDGESLRVGLNRLLRASGQTKMMFVVSDGKPYMQDADCDVLDADLHRAVMEAVNKKVVLAGLGFAPNHPVLGNAYIPVDDCDMVKSLEKLFGETK